MNAFFLPLVTSLIRVDGEQHAKKPLFAPPGPEELDRIGEIEGAVFSRERAKRWNSQTQERVGLTALASAAGTSSSSCRAFQARLGDVGASWPVRQVSRWRRRRE